MVVTRRSTDPKTSAVTADGQQLELRSTTSDEILKLLGPAVAVYGGLPGGP